MSRVTAVRNCTKDEGKPFGFGDQVADPKPPRAAAAPGRRGAGAVNVGRCTNLSTCFAPARPYLDSFEHDGTLGAVGMTIRGEPAFGRGSINRATTLYSVGPRTRTMMQPCASAAKLRGGGPILPLGMTAMSHLGTPPPRTVIGDPSQADGLGRNCRVPKNTTATGRRLSPATTS